MVLRDAASAADVAWYWCGLLCRLMCFVVSLVCECLIVRSFVWLLVCSCVVRAWCCRCPFGVVLLLFVFVGSLVLQWKDGGKERNAGRHHERHNGKARAQERRQKPRHGDGWHERKRKNVNKTETRDGRDIKRDKKINQQRERTNYTKRERGMDSGRRER